ncbi:MAG: vWA domain-containing protein [Gammaproteobacteria bacterium]
MMDSAYTAIAVLLDRSGSMQTIREDVEGGLRALLDEQRAQPGRATLRLTQFDDAYEVMHPSLPLGQVFAPALRPRGTTALLDAWGRAMVEFDAELADLPEEQRPANVLFVVVTDGIENSSREWTREQVMTKVTEQTEQWGWVFLYVAANQDAVAEGARYGVPGAQSVTYSHDPAGTRAAFGVVSSAVTRTRGGGAAGFTERERWASVGVGVISPRGVGWVADAVRRVVDKVVMWRRAPDRADIEVYPVAQVRAAATVHAQTTLLVGEFAARARGGGVSWADLAEPLGVAELAQREGVAAGEAAWDLVVRRRWPGGCRPGGGIPSTSWSCATCGRRVADRGPFHGDPRDRETGHSPDCSRHLGEVAARGAGDGDG